MEKQRIGIGLTRPTVETSQPPQDNREVWRELTELDNMVKSVTELSRNLLGRVEPVLRPVSNAEDTGVESKFQEITPLAEHLRQIRCRLGDAQLALSEIHERLEI